MVVDRQSDKYGERAMPSSQDVHVQQTPIELRFKVTAGSQTVITMDTLNDGGFLAAYGRDGNAKLRDLQETIARPLKEWFQRNPGNFSVIPE